MDYTYLVTGASSGIGKQTCLDLAKAGHNVVLIGRDHLRTNETLALCNQLYQGKHQSFTFDYLNGDLESLVEALPLINGIAHCAGVSKIIPIRNVSMKNLETMMKVNLYIPILLTTNLLRTKKLSDGSSVVFISSTAATFPESGQMAYSMTKAAIDVAVLSFTKEYTAKNKIRFNSIRSFYVKTPMLAGFENIIGSEKLKEIEIKDVPLGFSEPSDISEMIQFLLSEKSAKIAGSCLRIDGGAYCTPF